MYHYEWSSPWLMAQCPPQPDNGFRKDFPCFCIPQLESPPFPLVTAHQECVLAENDRDAGVWLDDFTPGYVDVTMGTYGRNGPVISDSTTATPTNVLGTVTILQASSPLLTQVRTPPVAQPQQPVQVSSAPKESFTSTGVWDVKPEPVTTPSPEPSPTNQVKAELRHLISSRQPKPSTSTEQETGEVRGNHIDPPHIQNGVDLERQERRREQNRQAAQRCRKRKRDLADTLSRECQALECSNTELRFKVRTLERERDELRRLWNAHVRRHGCIARATFKPKLSPATM